MRSRLLKYFGGLGVIVFGFGIYNQVVFGYQIKDTLIRTLMFPFFDTSWAKGFSEAEFSDITPGMAKDAVIGRLGRPLRETCTDTCEWVYSWQTEPTASFDRRAIYFNDFGYVVKIRKDLFLD